MCIYRIAKDFNIPKPVCNYSPEWAVVLYDGAVKYIYFIAEAKSTIESLNLHPIKQVKISCAKKFLNEISTDNVKYNDVDSYQSLLDVMNSIT